MSEHGWADDHDEAIDALYDDANDTGDYMACPRCGEEWEILEAMDEGRCPHCGSEE
jgi:transcription initiation factor IIE alpha subunit